MDCAFFTIFFHQFLKNFLVFRPVFDDVVLWVEQTAQNDIEFVVTGDVKLELNLTSLW